MSLRSFTMPVRRSGHVRALVRACVLLVLLVLGGYIATLRGAELDLATNLVTFVIPAGAGLTCLTAGLRSTGRIRRGWSTLGIACWIWAAGQVIWTVLLIDLGQGPLPWPTPAELGFASFPIIAIVGLWWLAPRTSGLTLPRRLLDGLVVASALWLIVWVIALRPVVDASDVPQPMAVSAFYYPLIDVLMLTVVVLTVAQSRAHSPSWRLLCAAALSFTVSDSLLALQIAHQSPTLSVVGWGWCVAFLLFGAAGWVANRAPDSRRPGHRGSNELAQAAVLPYLPLAVAVPVSLLEAVAGGGLDAISVVLGAAMVSLVMVRQFITVRENQQLASELRLREVQLHRLAFHDELTGLPNRALFLDRLMHALELAEQSPHPVSVAFIDLDGFKRVNDSLGHQTGDTILVRIAERLRGALRPADTLARLGGDEFAVLIEQGDDARAVAEGLLAALEAPFHIDGRSVGMSACIGVATAERGMAAGEQASNLVHRADVAMYAVKAEGRGRLLVHSPAMDPPEGDADTDVSRAVVAALENGEIRAHFQPVVNTITGEIEMFEALARWSRHGVDLPPATFVQVLVDAGLAEKLTAMMLEQACAQLGIWSAVLGHHRLRVAVNVHPSEFTDDGLPERVNGLLIRNGLAPDQLELEMIEVAPGNRPGTAIGVIDRLRRTGVRIAVDDFGTGYSTLARLANMPVDTVKIDRSFVANIDHDERQRRFLASMLELARSLGLHTIVEGVERPGQLRELQRLSCDSMQGFLLGRPAAAIDIALGPVPLAELGGSCGVEPAVVVPRQSSGADTPDARDEQHVPRMPARVAGTVGGRR